MVSPSGSVGEAVGCSCRSRVGGESEEVQLREGYSRIFRTHSGKWQGQAVFRQDRSHYGSWTAERTSKPVLEAPQFDRLFSIMTDVWRGCWCCSSVKTKFRNRSSHCILFQKAECPSEKLFYHRKRSAQFIVGGTAFHFDIYVTNGQGEICVYTDHNPLLFLDKTVSGRLCRWKLLLQQYPIKIQHIPGRQNVVADTLSRAPVEWCRVQCLGLWLTCA